MARVTVEDCIRVVENRFDLVLCAAQIGRENPNPGRSAGVQIKDKPGVAALRQVASEETEGDGLMEQVVQGLRLRTEREQEPRSMIGGGAGAEQEENVPLPVDAADLPDGDEEDSAELPDEMPDEIMQGAGPDDSQDAGPDDGPDDSEHAA